MSNFSVALANLGQRDFRLFFVNCGADGRIGRRGGKEDVFGKVEIGALEPVRIYLHGEGGIDDGGVGTGVDEVASFPHVDPEISARGSDAPVVEVAERLWDMLAILYLVYWLLLLLLLLSSMTVRLDGTRQPCTHLHITGFVGFAQGPYVLPSLL
jgi:hypothetical protein